MSVEFVSKHYGLKIQYGINRKGSTFLDIRPTKQRDFVHNLV
jgi:hypothetical protein